MATRFKNLLIILILAVYSLLLIMQGLDFGDAGWHLTAYQNIIEYPDGVQYSFMYYLSSILGHLWQVINPEAGLYWNRLGMLVFFMATFFIYRTILTVYYPRFNWTGSLALVYLFVFRGAPESLNYDVFTMFFNVLAILFLFFGLTRDKSIMLFFAGLIIGLNIFIKLSNISGLFFFAVIPFYAYLRNWNSRRLLKYAGLTLTGFILGVLIILSIMSLLDHQQLFYENLAFLIDMSASNEATHGLLYLFKTYTIGYGKMALITGIAVIIMLGVRHFLKRNPRFIQTRLYFVILVLFLIGFGLIALKVGNPVWSKLRYIFLGLMLLNGLGLLLLRGVARKTRLLILFGIILLVIAPLGSDSGLEKMLWGSWLLGPMLLLQLRQGHYASIGSGKTRFKGSKEFCKVFTAVLTIAFLTYAWNNTYNDPGSRLLKRFPVDHPGLNRIYTTEERAEVVNELLYNIQSYANQGDTLLAFIEMPMIHYLTDTRPFLNTSWPKLLYSPELFESQLNQSVSNGKLPVILRQKMNMGATNWPVNPLEGYTEYLDSSIKYKEHGIVLNNFLVGNNYISVWENKAFEILVSVTGFSK